MTMFFSAVLLFTTTVLFFFQTRFASSASDGMLYTRRQTSDSLSHKKHNLLAILLTKISPHLMDKAVDS